MSDDVEAHVSFHPIRVGVFGALVYGEGDGSDEGNAGHWGHYTCSRNWLVQVEHREGQGDEIMPYLGRSRLASRCDKYGEHNRESLGIGRSACAS